MSLLAKIVSDGPPAIWGKDGLLLIARSNAPEFRPCLWFVRRHKGPRVAPKDPPNLLFVALPENQAMRKKYLTLLTSTDKIEI